MQVSVEEVGNLKRRLTITVPANQVEDAFDKKIVQLAKKAKIDGFRPGKAPISVIKQRFGAEVRQETLGEIVEKAWREAVASNNLKPVDFPQIEPKTVKPNEPLEFVASFEVMPEIDAIKFDMQNIDKPMVEITSADIDQVIEQLRKQQAKWNLVDRPAVAHDRVVVDYYAIFDGKSDEEHKIHDFPVELGTKTMLPGFEDGLMGIKAGEERKLNLTFPDDFSVAERAGKPVEFVIQAKQVFEVNMPAIDENFVKKLGVKSGNMDELKTQIQQSLSQERDRLVQEKLKNQVFQALLEQNPIEVPEGLIAREAQQIHDEIYPHQHNHHHHADAELAAFNEIAKKRVAISLLMREYAKQVNLQVDKARLQKRIQEIAVMYENPQEVIDWLATAEQRKGLEAQVMEDQLLDKLLENVPVIEKNMSYAELKGVRT